MAGEKQYIAIDLGAESGRVMLGIVGDDKLVFAGNSSFSQRPNQ